MGHSFHDLRVWQLSMDLSVSVYAATAAFPKHEIYGLSSQMRRASVSIASNLAEGSARNSRKDFKHFVAIARGSHAELQTQILLATRLDYLHESTAAETAALVDQIGRMLHALWQSLDGDAART